MRLTRLNQIERAGQVIDGRWKLSRDHTLEYRRRGPKETVVVKGPVVQAKANALVLRVEEQRQGGELVGRRLTLRGHWEADPKNRLRFKLDGRRGRDAWLVLEGSWQVGPHHEILYRFRRQPLKTKTRRERLLRFRGRWDVGEDKRLTYVLDARSDSAFRFRGTFQTPILLPKGGAVRYQLGAEARVHRGSKVVTLFGRWRLSRRWGLTFEVPYGGGRVRGIDFSAEFTRRSGGRWAARLRTRRGKPLGMELVLSRAFLEGQGEAFLRLRKAEEESRIEGGLRLRW